EEAARARTSSARHLRRRCACADDSEMANYISAHTKDCPKCNIRIEKNGGCNHMQCSKCKHDFCWMSPDCHAACCRLCLHDPRRQPGPHS
uniref:RING-type domain-containing protein n=1 Tax=Oryctolagus cuniculus TaxID=9986 RepID=A0A5F9CK12_RABIT